MEKRKKVKYLGRVQIKDCGRPADVFCTNWVKRDCLMHEVLLTDWLLKNGFDDAKRGYDTDRELRPDAEIVVQGQKVLVEMDTGSEGYQQLSARFRLHASHNDLVLWICQSERRLVGMMERAKLISSTALFTLYDSAEWVDLQGNKWRV